MAAQSLPERTHSLTERDLHNIGLVLSECDLTDEDLNRVGEVLTELDTVSESTDRSRLRKLLGEVETLTS